KLAPIEELIAGTSSGQVQSSGFKVPGSQPPPTKSAASLAGRIAAASEVVSGFSRTEGNFKDALLAEIKKSKAVFYNMVVAQAQKIEVTGDRVIFTFAPAQRTLYDTVDQQKAWLEGLAQQLSGRRIAVVGVLSEAAPPAAQAAPKTEVAANASVAGSSAAPASAGDNSSRKATLREQALADAGVQ